MQDLRDKQGPHKVARLLHLQEVLPRGGRESWASRNTGDHMDRFADAINKIKTNERIGRQECVVASTKLMRTVLDLLKSESYINDYEEFTDRKFKMLRDEAREQDQQHRSGQAALCGAACRLIQKYEMRYIPSRDFGMLILSTSQGVMTNKEAKEKSIGGRLLAYVY